MTLHTAPMTHYPTLHHNAHYALNTTLHTAHHTTHYTLHYTLHAAKPVCVAAVRIIHPGREGRLELPLSTLACISPEGELYFSQVRIVFLSSENYILASVCCEAGCGGVGCGVVGLTDPRRVGSNRPAQTLKQSPLSPTLGVKTIQCCKDHNTS